MMLNGPRTVAAFFAATPQGSDRPVIRYGNGFRVIDKIVGKPNSKGMVSVETVPDLADGNTSITLKIRQSTEIVRFFAVKQKAA